MSSQALVSQHIPAISFAATTGEAIALTDRSRGDFVLFLYPRTGRPDRPESDDWALIPGAKGCTAESCEFRDLGFTMPPKEAVRRSRRQLERRYANVIYFNEPADGGHFLALEQSDTLVNDVRATFAGLR